MSYKRKEIIGDCTLYLDDCRDIIGKEILSADALIVDPPYGIGFKYASHIDDIDLYDGMMQTVIEAAESILTSNSPCFVWQSATRIDRIANLFYPREWRLFIAAKNFVQMRPTAMQWSYDPVVCWWHQENKPWSAKTATRDFYMSNTAPVISSPDNIEKQHPCPRPLDVVMHIVSQWVRPMSICLDPFMGSGTTGVACVQLGRKFTGIEIEPRYFDIACERISRAVAQGRLFDAPVIQQTQADLLDSIGGDWRAIGQSAPEAAPMLDDDVLGHSDISERGEPRHD